MKRIGTISIKKQMQEAERTILFLQFKRWCKKQKEKAFIESKFILHIDKRLTFKQ